MCRRNICTVNYLLFHSFLRKICAFNYIFYSILFCVNSPSLLRPFATSNRRGKLDPKCVPQLLSVLLLGTRQSAIGQFLFFLSLITVQEVFTKLN